MHAIEKARHRSKKEGTSEPLAIDKLDGLLMPTEKSVRGNAGTLRGRRRIRGTGASKGMTNIKQAVGKPIKGPKT